MGEQEYSNRKWNLIDKNIPKMVLDTERKTLSNGVQYWVSVTDVDEQRGRLALTRFDRYGRSFVVEEFPWDRKMEVMMIYTRYNHLAMLCWCFEKPECVGIWVRAENSVLHKVRNVVDLSTLVVGYLGGRNKVRAIPGRNLVVYDLDRNTMVDGVCSGGFIYPGDLEVLGWTSRIKALPQLEVCEASTSRSTLPDDLTLDILSRLPPKLVIGIRSRLPMELRQSTFSVDFTMRNLMHVHTHTYYALIHVWTYVNSNAIYSYGDPKQLHPITNFPGSNTQCHIDLIGSPNGIVLVVQGHLDSPSLSLWNPTTGSTWHAPPPTLDYGQKKKRFFGFGYYPKEDHQPADYKILHIVSDDRFHKVRAECYSQSNGYWKGISDKSLAALFEGGINVVMKHRYSLVAHNIPYWRSAAVRISQGEVEDLQDKLVSFHQNDSFYVEEFPWNIRHEMRLGVADESLYAFVGDGNEYFDIWVKTFQGTQGWIKRYKMLSKQDKLYDTIVGIYKGGVMVRQVDQTRQGYFNNDSGPGMMKIFDLTKNTIDDEFEFNGLNFRLRNVLRVLEVKKTIVELPRGNYIQH